MIVPWDSSVKFKKNHVLSDFERPIAWLLKVLLAFGRQFGHALELIPVRFYKTTVLYFGKQTILQDIRVKL